AVCRPVGPPIFPGWWRIGRGLCSSAFPGNWKASSRNSARTASIFAHGDHFAATLPVILGLAQSATGVHLGAIDTSPAMRYVLTSDQQEERVMAMDMQGEERI